MGVFVMERVAARAGPLRWRATLQANLSKRQVLSF